MVIDYIFSSDVMFIFISNLYKFLLSVFFVIVTKINLMHFILFVCTFS